ncbi:MAG: amino acid ABC transporter permease [Oscillospiraceae bacterium]|nr:amino acid ABC transporter permease [Oscillospiraceae bacterium]
MSAANVSIQRALYEAPGPKTKRRIAVGTGISLVAVAALLALILRQFYVTGQLDARYWSLFTRATTWRFLGQGLAGTLKVALMSSLFAFVIGMGLMLLRLSSVRLARWIGTALVELSRGIPTLLFIYFFFLVAPQFGLKLPTFWKIALPVSISASGVVAEVLRSGVHAVPKGLTEAALALGMRSGTVFFKIVFPQGLRYVVPSLISELVIVLKDTTFAYVVSYADLMQNARVLISNYDALLSVYLVVAVIYILINYLLHRLSVFVAGRSRATGATREAKKG